METQIFGIFRSSSEIQIENIEKTDNYKKFSNVVKIQYEPSHTGNGDFYIKIFTQEEFKKIISGNWSINPFIKGSYNHTNVWAKIDIADSNGKEIQCSTIIDPRTIYKQNGDKKLGIKNFFNFITSLRKYINVNHYLLCDKIDKILKDWECYDADDVILTSKEFEEAVTRYNEIKRDYEMLLITVNKHEDLLLLNDLRDNQLQKIESKYNLFKNKGTRQNNE